MNVSRHIFLAFIFILHFNSVALATIQIPDTLTIDEKEFALQITPLRRFIARNKKLEKRFFAERRSSCSAAWDGYQAKWKLESDQLFLTKILVNPCRNPPTLIPLSEIWSEPVSQLQAFWYTGRIYLPYNEVLAKKYSVLEIRSQRYIVITIKQGHVVLKDKKEAK